MTASVPFKPKRLSLCIAAVLSGAAGSAQAVPMLHAETHYSINGSPVVSQAQDSSTSVDIFEFAASGDVSIFAHTFGFASSATFGSRVDGNIGGTGSYDVSGLFRLTIPDDEVGSSFSFNIIPGEVEASGPASLFAGGPDFVSAFLTLDITVGGNLVFHSEASAEVDGSGATAGFGGTDIGYTCVEDPSGFASCSISGGAFNLAGLGEGDLVYTIFTQAEGSVSDPFACGGFGNGSDFQAEFLIGDGGEGGGGAFCGSIARTGDPLGARGVPEPGSLGLAGLGLAALGLARRRKQRT